MITARIGTLASEATGKKMPERNIIGKLTPDEMPLAASTVRAMEAMK